MNIYNPFKKIKELERQLHVAESDLNFEIENLKLDKIELKKKKDNVTARAVVEKIIGDGVEWYDANELSQSEMVTYYNNSQLILKNPVFINTINRLINEWGEWSLKRSQDFDGIRDVRMNVIGMTLLKEELESVVNPSSPRLPSKEPHSPI